MWCLIFWDVYWFWLVNLQYRYVILVSVIIRLNFHWPSWPRSNLTHTYSALFGLFAYPGKMTIPWFLMTFSGRLLFVLFYFYFLYSLASISWWYWQGCLWYLSYWINCICTLSSPLLTPPYWQHLYPIILPVVHFG